MYRIGKKVETGMEGLGNKIILPGIFSPTSSTVAFRVPVARFVPVIIPACPETSKSETIQ